MKCASLLRRLIPGLAVIVGYIQPVSSAETCGLLVHGVECVLLQADDGGSYLIAGAHEFAVGERVCVTGELIHACVSICQEGSGCINATHVYRAPSCAGPNPAGCAQTGCDAGERCDQQQGCNPSQCSCTEAGWVCTDDCGGGICVPTFPTPGCIAEWAWLDRDLPVEGVAGSPVVVNYGIRGGPASIVEVEETIPSGWQVISPMWIERRGDTYVWDHRITAVELLPPAGLLAGDYHFRGSTISWHSCNGEVYRTIEGDSVIRIDSADTSCPGDCDGNGSIWVDELVTAINIALDTVDLVSCPSADTNDDGAVTVDELSLVVHATLSGCPEDL